MKLQGLYKHRKNTEIAFYVSRITELNGSLQLNGILYNVVNPANIYPIDNDTIIIKTTDLNNWILLQE